MAASFGDQLRLAREARGISLREISEQTRISVRYLEAIETGDYKRLPGGIFNRSFVKAYAKHIGYDEKEAMEGYAQSLRDQGSSPDDVASTPYQPHVYTDGGTRSPLVTLLLTILILAILSLGVYAALHWYQRREAEKANGNPPAPHSQQTAPNTRTNSAPGASTVPSPSSATNNAAGLDIQLKARGEQVWVRAYVDDSSKAAFAENLNAEQTKEFKAIQRLRIQSSKDKISMLEVSINGRNAKVPVDTKGILAEMIITKDDYEKFLQ